MRKIIFQMMVSLDGYFEGPNKELDWHVVDEEFNEYASGLLDSVDMLLFGRVTYQLMANYWPTPSARTNDPIIAKKMNELPKIVFSTTLKKAEWQNSRLVKENAEEEISKLKQQPGKNMAIFGSSDLVVSLMESGLIDEYRIMVNPVVLGGGKPLLKGLKDRLNLDLAGTKTFKSGLVLLYYRPRVITTRKPVPASTPSSSHEFIITRIIDAPRESVFKAWTDPMRMAQWWGPHGFTNPVCKMDARLDGAWRIVMRAPDGIEYPLKGVYREIAVPKRLIFTNNWEEHPPEWHELLRRNGADKPSHEALNTVTFEEREGKTLLTILISFESVAVRDAMAKMGMSEGWTQSLERLEAHLAKAWPGETQAGHVVPGL